MQVTNDLPEALKSVERALALDPVSGNPHLYATATQVLLASSRPAEAISVARRGIGTLGASQDTFQIYVDLARALATTGQRSDAIAVLDAALVIRPGDPEALELRAQIVAGTATQ